jgi:hypothetical protein
VSDPDGITRPPSGYHVETPVGSGMALYIKFDREIRRRPVSRDFDQSVRSTEVSAKLQGLV